MGSAVLVRSIANNKVGLVWSCVKIAILIEKFRGGQDTKFKLVKDIKILCAYYCARTCITNNQVQLVCSCVKICRLDIQFFLGGCTSCKLAMKILKFLEQKFHADCIANIQFETV